MNATREEKHFLPEATMTDPATTIAVGTIVNLAFQKFAEAGGAELAKKFTEAGIKGIEALWQKIRERLWGKSAKVNDALLQAEGGDQTALGKITSYLDTQMDEDEAFAAAIQQLAHEITLNQKQGDNGQIQNNFGGTNFQNQISGGTVNQATTINVNQGLSQD